MKTNHVKSITPTPAGFIIQKLGVKRLADWTGLSEVQIRRWDYAKDKGGCAGQIPNEHIKTIVNKARDSGFDIAYSDFFNPPVEEFSE